MEEFVKLDKTAGTLSVLLAPNSQGELKMTKLCGQLRLEKGTVERAASLRRELDLVELRASPRFPFSKSLMLTGFGSRLVRRPLAEWSSALPERSQSRRATGWDRSA